jgi:UDP-N-acetylglucosamine 2-epimerase (non-hydrolysing)
MTASPWLAIVVGTRPEIIKLGHVARALSAVSRFVHTRQHEDPELAGVFLAAAGIEVSRTLAGIRALPRHAQIGRMVEQLGDLFEADRPAAVIVQGDTNSASSAAQAANYVGVPVIHVEAGLRSHDRAMPEEINRCVTGVLADVHCAPTPLAVRQLLAEAVPADRIVLTGNTIVETTLAMMPTRAEATETALSAGAEPGGFVLATIHRAENTDNPDRLRVILDQLAKLGLPVLLPLHPRTRSAARAHGLTQALDRLRVLPPADHRTFLGLASVARLIVSDSGGVQEECTVLKRPLLVVRNSTERPESITAGFAWLVPADQRIGELGRELISDASLDDRLSEIPCPFGDGTASDQIAAIARGFLDRAAALAEAIRTRRGSSGRQQSVRRLRNTASNSDVAGMSTDEIMGIAGGCR